MAEDIHFEFHGLICTYLYLVFMATFNIFHGRN